MARAEGGACAPFLIESGGQRVGSVCGLLWRRAEYKAIAIFWRIAVCFIEEFEGFLGLGLEEKKIDCWEFCGRKWRWVGKVLFGR